MSISIKELGSYFVGGEVVSLSGLDMIETVYAANGHTIIVNPNGQYMSGQMYVQYVHLENPKCRYPISMWHGGGLTGSTWEKTPDGRPGWQSYFLNAGYHVHLTDAVERGRSSWCMYPEIFPEAPTFRTFQHCWKSFRIGAEYKPGGENHPFPGSQFPVADYDEILKMSVPRWSCNNEITQKAYHQYVEQNKLGGMIIIAHSQGGAFALKACASCPGKVNALVLLEPSGTSDFTDEEVAALAGIPQLIVWGDYIGQSEMWQKYQSKICQYYERVKKLSPDVTWMSLPELGIKGNSHMLYMERNSDVIAGIVEEWLAKHVKS